MGVYVFSRDVLLEVARAGATPPTSAAQIIPAALGRYRVHAHLFRGYWADVGTVASFYDANIMLTQPGAPFKFYDPRRPIYTHPRFLPGARLSDCTVRDAIIAEGCYIDAVARSSNRSSASAPTSRRGATIRRSVLLGADFYEADDDAPARATARGSASAATSCSIG